MKKAEKVATEKTAKKIIVSRKHAGSVENVAKQAFGKDTVIIPAGGAGKISSEQTFSNYFNQRV